MRFIHAADIHFAARNPEPALMSLAKIAEVGRERDVGLIVIAGDLFDAPIRNSDADSMPRLLDACAALLDVAPVVSVQGTPSHDAPGCYAPIFRRDEGWYHFDNANAGQVVMLTDGRELKWWTGDWRGADPTEVKALVTGLPEPSRGWLDGHNPGAEVTDALRSVLFGIGAATHGRTVPHIHVQHGEVRGATLANGQVLPPGGIAVGTEDLALTGADYVALGHIHARQCIPSHGQAVVYSGSAYPVDWGERDEKAMSVVEVAPGALEDGGGVVDTVSVPYGHPPRVKHEWQAGLDMVTGPSGGYGDAKGADVWAVAHAPADFSEPAGAGVTSRIREKYEAAGANSVRVTVERAPRERIRAPEIRDAESWRDQVFAWANATDSDVPVTAGDIIDSLQAEARKSGALPVARKWRIKSLRLRGSIGVWRGTGRDEIAIDFDNYAAGIVAVTGPNGAGKTTLIENCTPWPTMLTRSGPLQQHFRLRDSVRELVIADDEAYGKLYRCLIQIDSQTGKREQRVYHQVLTAYGPDEWQPLGADGGTAEYERVCDELWGPRSLHMLSVVSPQKPVSIRVRGDDGEAVTVTTDLAAASRGMRRAILRQLLGLAAYQAAANKAKVNANSEHDTADSARIQAARYIDDSERLEAAERQEQVAAKAVSEGVLDQIKAETKLSDHRRQLSVLATQADESRKARERYGVLRSQIDDAEHRLQEIDREREALANPGPGREEAEGTLLRMAQDDAELRGLRTDYDHELAAHDVESKAHERRRLDARAAHDLAQEADNRAAQRIEVNRVELEQAMGNDTVCNACGQSLQPSAIARIMERREQLRVAGNQLRADHEQASARAAKTRQALQLIERDMPRLPATPDRLNVLVREQPRRDAARVRAQATIREADQAQAKAQDLTNESTRVSARLASLDALLTAAKGKINDTAEVEERRYKELVDTATWKLSEAKGAVGIAERDLRHAKADVERCQQAHDKRVALLETAAKHEKQAQAHKLVATALGPDGVQSLLLEAAAPRIAEVANDLLERSYGARWRVRIELQRTSGTGSRAKVVEDVRIIVRDAESTECFGDDDLEPGEQLLETLSGGEGVWIRAAISAAIGRVRAERTGVEWRTVLLDEADAGLDEGAAASYWRLVEAAHAQAGRHHTVAITHSGAQHSFAQRIDMGAV